MNSKQFKALTNNDLGPLRANIVRLLEELTKLSHTLLEGELIMRGTVYEMKRKCGGKNCVCVTEGKLHGSMVLSWSEEGKTRLKTLPEADIANYRKLTNRYREFRKVRRRVEKVFDAMLKLIDRTEAKRSKEP